MLNWENYYQKKLKLQENTLVALGCVKCEQCKKWLPEKFLKEHLQEDDCKTEREVVV